MLLCKYIEVQINYLALTDPDKLASDAFAVCGTETMTSNFGSTETSHLSIFNIANCIHSSHLNVQKRCQYIQLIMNKSKENAYHILLLRS